MTLMKQIYKPMMSVGQIYGRPYGSIGPRMPLGNVLEAELTHEEEEKKLPDMTRSGGGTYARVTRVTSVRLKLVLADWNPINYTRSVFGTAGVVAAGSVTDAAHVAHKGGLLRLAHPSPTVVTVKKGTDVIAPAGYEVRPEGIYLLDSATGFADGDSLLASYTYPEHVNIEAITGSAPELEVNFGGLNEAESGKPVILDVWRMSSGITKSLSLIQSDFGKLEVEGEVLLDPTKTGVGISKFYRTQMV